VAVAETGDDRKPFDPMVRQDLAGQLHDIPEVAKKLVVPVTPAAADWLLRPDGDHVNLVRREGMVDRLPPIAKANLARDLSQRLRKIARAEGIKRLVTPPPSSRSVTEGRTLNFDVELLKFSGADDPGAVVSWPKEALALSVGDDIVLRFTNQGRRPADITVLHIDPNYEISAWLPPAPFIYGNRLYPQEHIQTRNKSLYSEHAVIDKDAAGVHYFVVMAVNGEGFPSDFAGLAQDTLEDAKKGLRGPDVESDIGNLIESLYDQSSVDNVTGKVRGDLGKGLSRKKLNDYVVRVYRWEVGAKP
jgi:hypothetical protein